MTIAPFLKVSCSQSSLLHGFTSSVFVQLYATYTAGFEDAMKILTELMAKDKKLDCAVKEFEVHLHVESCKEHVQWATCVCRQRVGLTSLT